MLDYYSRLQDHFSRLAASTSAFATAAGDSSPSTSGAPGGWHPPRRLWVKHRSQVRWDQCNHPNYPEAEFRRAFRMGRATFDMICEKLGSVVAKEDTMLRLAIPVQQRVVVCIWRLATSEPLRLVSKCFGLGISTCHKLVLEVCSTFKTVLMPRFLQWLDDAATNDIRSWFKGLFGTPLDQNVLPSVLKSSAALRDSKIGESVHGFVLWVLVHELVEL